MTKSALAITEEHQDLAEAALGQLNRLGSRAAARATLEKAGGYPDKIWAAGAGLGWNGLAVSEEYGGSGFGLSELAVVVEVAGRELCPGPFLPTVSAAVVIDRSAPDSVRAELLPGLADGTTVAALGLAGSVTIGPDGLLGGQARAVLGAPDAHILVLAAGEDIVILDATADGITVTAQDSLDTTRSIGAVDLRAVA
ncbi:acyl-CoA dehydrogenase family protein, partial [Mycolicibacterium fortuitum]